MQIKLDLRFGTETDRRLKWWILSVSLSYITLKIRWYDFGITIVHDPRGER